LTQWHKAFGKKSEIERYRLMIPATLVEQELAAAYAAQQDAAILLPSA
jgi:hypothetical protein